ncbi:dentin sialophosphoprotein-like isoform X4 [Mya arenaria]|uniref:dentin sialophosphoprotein-like isoform X4 n=1 Tax=Mya arenaria TaxID=6604 RepID=UPI0022E81709|nr:dentin sialophosphoprotein-like isoform X4 [Mya arenaria]
MGNCNSVFSCACWRITKKESEAEMGNQESSLADIPVYYRAGIGVSLYQPPHSPSLRNRKTHPTKLTSHNTEHIKGNLTRGKNGLTETQTLLGGQIREGLPGEQQGKDGGIRVRDLGQLRIEIDESGYVEDDGGEDGGDRLSNSLKGNFSPTSLCEKNFKLYTDSENHFNSSAVNDNHSAKSVPDHLFVDPHIGTSSALLTPPSEDEFTSSSNQFVPSKGKVNDQSTKSDVSDLHSEVADPTGTDEEREQLSPLPYDKPVNKSPERSVCPQKLKLKLSEIASQSKSVSLNSSSRSSPESFSQGHKRTGSGSDRNSISGISSPELELLNSEHSEGPVVYASTFNTIENEIHGVEDEFDTISKEIQALSNKYSTLQTDPGQDILKEIFQRYPSIRVRQFEHGVFYDNDPSQDSHSTSESRSQSESRNKSESRATSEMGDGSIDLSWDVENMMDLVYTEGSDQGAPIPTGNCSLPPGTNGGIGTTSFNTSSINCSVELDGSLYEDEFHLHLGTSTLSKIEEQLSEPQSLNGSSDFNAQLNDATICAQSMDSTTSLQTIDSNTSVQMIDSTTSLKTVCNESFLDGSEVLEEYNYDQHHVTEALQEADNNKAAVNEVQNRDVTSESSDTFSTAPLASPISDTTALSTHTNSLPSAMCTTDSNDSNDGQEEVTVPQQSPSLNNVGERVEIKQYADSEWRGDTQKANTLRQAYRAIPDHCKCCYLRRIRGDNYCGVRGTLFQTLTNALPPLHLWASKDSTLQQLTSAYHNKSSGIRKWTFAKRISYTKENKLHIMQNCLSTLYAMMETLGEHSTYTSRAQELVTLLNSDPDLDLRLMEGAKLLMALSALQLHGNMEQGDNVPVFAWLLFARDSSQNVAGFVRNHLNLVGQSGGLEQVEMCLLGYSLGVRIRVLRLHQFHEEDFVAYFPEDGTDSWHCVTLIAEDDRHYNVPVL